MALTGIFRRVIPPTFLVVVAGLRNAYVPVLLSWQAITPLADIAVLRKTPYRRFQPRDRTLLAVGWFTPVIARSCAKLLYLPIGFLLLVAVFWLVIERCRAVLQVEAADPGDGARGVQPA